MRLMALLTAWKKLRERKATMADDKSFLGANDIAEILGCSASYAYNIIWQLNAELQEKKYITAGT